MLQVVGPETELHGVLVDSSATRCYRRTDHMTIKSSVSLTDQQHAFARTLVDAGRYSSVSAVLQQGLDLLRRRLEDEELERMALREVLARRREREFVAAERMDRRLADMIAAKRRSHGLPS